MQISQIRSRGGKPGAPLIAHFAMSGRRAAGAASVEEVQLRLLETQEEQDRWLSENREAISAKIQRGIEQLNCGEEIPEDQLDAPPVEADGQA
jgi:hypothetical protein